jgi:exopolysaccharide biosynthesis polyprenyl glycosylphosphotransferase
MTQRREIAMLWLGDFVALNLAWYLFFWLRVSSGLFFFWRLHSDLDPSLLPMTSLEIYGFWLVMFLVFGLYRPWYVRPPFDEIVTLLKTLAVGTVLLSLIIWWDPVGSVTTSRNDPRLLSLTYLAITILCCVSVRLIIRFTQRRLLVSGVGARPSLIVGEPEQARSLAENLVMLPQFGYDVVGYVSPNGVGSGPSHLSVQAKSKHGVLEKQIPRFGTLDNLETVIEKHGIKEVLVALGSNEHDKLMGVISRASRSNTGLKILPDLYDIVSGQARTREIYGFPLIDINPVILRPWEEVAKRSTDIVVSLFGLIFGSPVWIASAIAVWFSSKGPILYTQERVGRDGKVFRIYKLRSMYIDAESGGPQWASKNDPRVTPVGRFLRKTHLDEIPQLWNVLKGDMSLVGPRPEREFFVKQLIQEIPYYNRRHKVRPGVTGLYQTAVHKYDESLDDVKLKVKYDLMYIESMSFRLDMKIIFRTAYMMFHGKGQA